MTKKESAILKDAVGTLKSAIDVFETTIAKLGTEQAEQSQLQNEEDETNSPESNNAQHDIDSFSEEKKHQNWKEFAEDVVKDTHLKVIIGVAINTSGEPMGDVQITGEFIRELCTLYLEKYG